MVRVNSLVPAESDYYKHYEHLEYWSMYTSVKTYAAKGIKLIPVAASGIDKKTEQLNSLIVRLIKKYTE